MTKRSCCAGPTRQRCTTTTLWALAIRNAAVAREIDPISHAVCEFTLGKGVRAVINGNEIRLGNKKYFAENGINTDVRTGEVAGLIERGLTVIFLAKEYRAPGCLAFPTSCGPTPPPQWPHLRPAA